MPKYNITAKTTILVFETVRADNEEEARAKGRKSAEAEIDRLRDCYDVSFVEVTDVTAEEIEEE